MQERIPTVMSLTMRWTGLWTWFVGEMWKSSELQATAALECSRQTSESGSVNTVSAAAQRCRAQRP